jgi:DNA-directed RNA polymerase subunit RPC12/RpoP
MNGRYLRYKDMLWKCLDCGDFFDIPEGVVNITCPKWGSKTISKL